MRVKGNTDECEIRCVSHVRKVGGLAIRKSSEIEKPHGLDKDEDGEIHILRHTISLGLNLIVE